MGLGEKAHRPTKLKPADGLNLEAGYEAADRFLLGHELKRLSGVREAGDGVTSRSQNA
jgi:hypothetical protein